MTTTDTTQENKHQPGLHLTYLLLASILVITLLILTVLSLRKYIPLSGLQAQSTSIPQAPEITDGDLYMMVQGWDGYNHVLVLSPNSGKVNRRFETGYNAVVKFRADKHILYVYNQGYSESATNLKGGVSAIDAHSGALLWQATIPGEPFGPSTNSAWLSADEQHLYLMGSPDNFHPHIFVVDTATGTMLHDFELTLPYPSNADMAFPLAWKLPWNETLVVASRDKLFVFDLISGQASDVTQLFGSDSNQRVPLNLPHTAYVQNGAVDWETRQLFLATSTQEILVIDMHTTPLTVTSAAVLPVGWQYTIMQPFLYHPTEKAIYVQVRRSDEPDIFGGLIAEEILRYDTTTWVQTDRLDLRERLTRIPNLANENSNKDLANYGLALTADGHVYSLSRQGLLRLSLEHDGRSLNGTWLNMREVGMDFARIFTIP